MLLSKSKILQEVHSGFDSVTSRLEVISFSAPECEVVEFVSVEDDARLDLSATSRVISGF